MSWDLKPRSQWLDRVVFLGTGTSSQVPAISCVTDGAAGTATCETCADALRPASKNRRGCTSAMVLGSASNEETCILIDCGKSFYESTLRYFPAHGLRRIDAVLLTHAHADAILGLDDLRSWTMGGVIQEHVDVYLTQECMDTVRHTFPYLIDKSFITGGGDVGALRWHIITADAPFSVGRYQVPVMPLPVEHGFAGKDKKPFECLGFRIDSMSYVSDCRIAGSTLYIVDGLKLSRHASHFSIPQAIVSSVELGALDIPPQLTLITDLTHRTEHYKTERQLQTVVHALDAYLAAHPDTDMHSPWWEHVWDPDSNERKEMLAPRQSAAIPPKTQPMHIAPIHLAFDGLCVTFTKCT
ncbi:hypothetical protein MVES1_002221 [Malassezia vespertilionis]|uniref:uncharacterized protein n=1 Tax=Malassezia vespertilionis TaxID=2020962 RepID=UPI0024B0A373|nr:uncharacterized protein MVES1_002221 [Malassezia vespertilionis]WFD06866.1 hypothetical protein MVES1_002221 [Malassezia vespertilionis]